MFHRKIRFLLVLCFCLLSGAMLQAHAQVYDAAKDFSATNNPNGVWSYGWSTTQTSALNLYTVTSVVYNLNIWKSSIGPDPNVIHNGTSSLIDPGYAKWPAGQLSLSPGPSGEYSHVRFTASVAGAYQIASSFIGLDYALGTTTDVHVLINGTSLFDGNITGYGNSTAYNSASPVTLKAGDTIDFVVGYGSNNSNADDTTGLSATITLATSAPSDFNGDGHPDLLFQNASTGQLAVWYMNGVTPSGGAFVTPSQSSGWKAVGDADFNADGHPDILFQNSSTNQLALWIMNGVTATGGQLLSPTPPAGWKAVSIADFDGDGTPDLLLQNSSSGQLAIWYMNGSAITGGAYISAVPASGWIAVGSADFNADGKSDILLQNLSTGQLAVWYMNNATATGGAYITPTQQAGWKCVSVIDLNADGKPDLVFQNTTSGQLVYWLMNGVKATGGALFSQQPQSGWQVVGPH